MPIMEKDSEQTNCPDYSKNLETYSKMLVHANRNFEEKVKALSIIRRLGDSLLYAQDLNKIAREVLSIIIEEFETEFCSLMVLNHEKKYLRLFAATSRTESGTKYFDDSGEIFLGLEEGIAGLVASMKASILSKDTENDQRFLPKPKGHLIRSLLCVPLVARDKILGVINLASPIKDDFNEEEERIMKIVGDQTALAMENAMLVRERVRTDRFSTIGNMAATIVHDIKNPMAKLRGFTELMADPTTPQEEREEFAQIIVSEIERFVAMTEELMEFARGGESKLNFETMPAEDLINGTIPFLKRDFSDAKIELISTMEFDGLINIDFQKFQRVIFNLTGNAKDAMPKGGKVTVRGFQEEKFFVLSIQDSGQGIPQKILEKIFVPFVTYGKRKGTGLGLAIVKKIVEEHGGTIQAFSEEGKGSEFIIRVPVKKE